MTVEATNELRLEKDEGIATLTFNRPEKMNAMTTEMWLRLREIIEDVRRDEETKVLVMTGSGNAFCAGSDVVKRLAARVAGEQRDATRREKLEPVGYLASLINSMSKPIIGAINGVAAGAGISLALLCDIRIASEKARFGAAWVKIGLIPDLAATYLLPRTVGLDKALELMITGDVIGAREAERIGLVTRVVPDEDLLKVSTELARRIAQGPTIAIDFIKRAAYRGLFNTLDEQLDFESYAQNVCRGTEDHREGVAAFQEKRPPRFRGL